MARTYYAECLSLYDWKALKTEAYNNWIETMEELFAERGIRYDPQEGLVYDKGKTYGWGSHVEIPEATAYLGSCFCIMPSGKYYTSWASSNVTAAEVRKDEAYWNALEKAAGKYDLYLTGGEGDPTDIFVGFSPTEEDARQVWELWKEAQSDDIAAFVEDDGDDWDDEEIRYGEHP